MAKKKKNTKKTKFDHTGIFRSRKSKKKNRQYNNQKKDKDKETIIYKTPYRKDRATRTPLSTLVICYVYN